MGRDAERGGGNSSPTGINGAAASINTIMALSPPVSHPHPPHLRSSRDSLGATDRSGERDGGRGATRSKGAAAATRASGGDAAPASAAGGDAPGDRRVVAGSAGGDASGGEGDIPKPLQVARHLHGDPATCGVRGARSLCGRRRWDGLRVHLLGDSGGGVIRPEAGGEMGAFQDKLAVKAQHTPSAGAADLPHPSRSAASGGRPPQGPLKLLQSGAWALQGAPALQTRRRRTRGSTLEPPPWSGDCGEKPRSKVW
ncbi:uncharacterized PE-PGRS family protein PE_PGRS46-like isoform X1 [Triticum dicoccoides]|uniref:uncharacterized PE-PGRS family protein PE_PGRS46-like isoform X1 n=1 Tax=Triticum dicoccoides TaxID=85692 RepID=UPI001890A19F|nr:uncharacterized PE-PGRS family protein PE_PGRS46-like isoform X1 [Triticum dicoccoides]